MIAECEVEGAKERYERQVLLVLSQRRTDVVAVSLATKYLQE